MRIGVLVTLFLAFVSNSIGCGGADVNGDIAAGPDGSHDALVEAAADSGKDGSKQDAAVDGALVDAKTDVSADGHDGAADSSIPPDANDAQQEAGSDGGDAGLQDAADTGTDAPALGPCSQCHGGSKGAAPPTDTHHNSSTSAPGVGAHQSHLADSSWHHNVACEECHIVPSVPHYDPAVPTHLNGIDDLVWGATAKQGVYDVASLKCQGTWCHGGMLLPDVPGSASLREPMWTKVDGLQSKCGTSCHSLPPGGYHPASDSCPSCHGPVVSSYVAGDPPTVTWADPKLHVDGKVDVSGLVCTTCHGDKAKSNPAPPLGTHGETQTTEPAVGAHARHLAASTWHRQGECVDCHAIPTGVVHANGVVDLDWGLPSTADGASPAFSAGTVTCTGAYCHGVTLLGPKTGGTVNREPKWTKVDGSYAECGTTCHTLPPGGVHPKSTTCPKCHAQVISAFVLGNPSTSTWADPSLHVNGSVNVTLTCTSCHGDPMTNDAAPPLGTEGETQTTEPAVGAHAQHLAPSTWHRDGQCSDCHVVPGSTSHANGVSDLAWSGPSTADGAAPGYDSLLLRCDGVYCHGTTLLGPKPGGTVARTPIWTQVDGSFKECGTTCHTLPPGGKHPPGAACPKCHAQVISAFDPANPSASTWLDRSLHVDGVVQLTLTCTSCHGDETSNNPAPPMGTHGETLPSQAAVGAHAQHLGSSTWHRDGQCADCHVLPTSTLHANGIADFGWGAPASADGATPGFDSGALTCSGVYCHGATLLGPNPGGTVNRTPIWTTVDGSFKECGTTCHTLPPGGTHPTYPICPTCHSPVIATFIPATKSATWTDHAMHVDGTVQRQDYHDLSGWTSPKGTPTHHGDYYLKTKKDEHGAACRPCHGIHNEPSPVGVPCAGAGCHNLNDCTVCHKIH